MQFKLLVARAAVQEQRELFALSALAAIADSMSLREQAIMRDQYIRLFGEPVGDLVNVYKELVSKWKPEQTS